MGHGRHHLGRNCPFPPLSFPLRILVEKNIDYRIREQLSDTMPYLAAASLMGPATFFAGALLVGESPIVLLSSQMAVGTVSYFLIRYTFQPLAYKDSVSDVLQYLRPNRTPDL